VRDQPLGVLHTGDGSVEYAQLVRQWSDDLVLFTDAHALTSAERGELEARGIRIVDGATRALVLEDDRLLGVVLGDGRMVERSALFFRPSLQARGTDLVACELDALGFIVVDATGRTSVPGVWAAGNVANPRAQVITAAGEGSAAAIAINADLVRSGC
jgi:thioredoxin reductase